MIVGVTAVAGCWDSGLTTVLDVLRTADTARHMVDSAMPGLAVRTVSTGSERVATAGGLLVTPDLTFGDAALAELDVLVIPALGARSAAGVVDQLGRADVQALRGPLRDWAAQGRDLAAACTGTFVLADAGLLDNRRVTTSWWLTGEFGRRYPKAELDMTRMVVPDGPILTAGAAFAHIDLAMTLVSRLSPQLAELTAAALLIDERPARSAESMSGYLAAADEVVTGFETWVRANLGGDISVADAARALGVTRRTLERRVQERLHVTPLAVIQRLRAERARHLRRTTSLTLSEIASMVGYRSAATLRSRLNAGGPGPPP